MEMRSCGKFLVPRDAAESTLRTRMKEPFSRASHLGLTKSAHEEREIPRSWERRGCGTLPCDEEKARNEANAPRLLQGVWNEALPRTLHHLRQSRRLAGRRSLDCP